MGPETVDVVMGVIERVAAMLEPGAQAVWEIAMRQVMVQGVKSACWAVLALAVVVTGIVIMRRCYNASYDENLPSEEADFYFLCMFAAFAATGGATVGLLFTVDAAISYLLNPAYYAIKLLLATAGVGG